jgi:hypothetical protein
MPPSLEPFRVPDLVIGNDIDVSVGPYVAIRAAWCDSPIAWEMPSTGLVARPALDALLPDLDQRVRSVAPPATGALSMTLVFGPEGDVIAVRIQIRDDAAPPDGALNSVIAAACGVTIAAAPGGQWVLEQRITY